MQKRSVLSECSSLFLSIFAFWGMWSSITPGASASEAQPINELAFSSEQYVTVQNADDAMKSITKSEKGAVKTTCRYPDGTTIACFAPACEHEGKPASSGCEGLPRVYLPLYPGVLPMDIQFPRRQITRVLGMYRHGCCVGSYWKNGDYLAALAPPDKVLQGDQVEAEWRKLADTKEFLKCKDDYCVGIVRGHTESSPETALFACRFSKSGSLIGAAPDFCRPVLLMDGAKTRVLAIVGEGCVCREEHMEGGPDFSINLKGSTAKSSRLIEALQHTLADPPLSLTVSPESKLSNSNWNSLIGTAKYRLSPVLQNGWREIVTIRLDLFNSSSVYEIVVSSTLYVNRQNTSRPSDYTAPSEQQEHAYVDAVKEQLRSSLTRLCGAAMQTPKYVDMAGSSIDCDIK